MYLLGCKVCGKQYISSNFTSFRARFKIYKTARKKFFGRVLVPQAELFRYFTEAGHDGFLEDVSFQIIDRVFGVFRNKERDILQSFMHQGLNARFEDH